MFQMKEKDKTPEEQLSEVEIDRQSIWKRIQSNDSKMIQNLGNRMKKIQETFNKDLEELKNKQTMMNNKINEI